MSQWVLRVCSLKIIYLSFFSVSSPNLSPRSDCDVSLDGYMTATSPTVGYHCEGSEGISNKRALETNASEITRSLHTYSPVLSQGFPLTGNAVETGLSSSSAECINRSSRQDRRVSTTDIHELEPPAKKSRRALMVPEASVQSELEEQRCSVVGGLRLEEEDKVIVGQQIAETDCEKDLFFSKSFDSQEINNSNYCDERSKRKDSCPSLPNSLTPVGDTLSSSSSPLPSTSHHPSSMIPPLSPAMSCSSSVSCYSAFSSASLFSSSTLAAAPSFSIASSSTFERILHLFSRISHLEDPSVHLFSHRRRSDNSTLSVSLLPSEDESSSADGALNMTEDSSSFIYNALVNSEKEESSGIMGASEYGMTVISGT